MFFGIFSQSPSIPNCIFKIPLPLLHGFIPCILIPLLHGLTSRLLLPLLNELVPVYFPLYPTDIIIVFYQSDQISQNLWNPASLKMAQKPLPRLKCSICLNFPLLFMYQWLRGRSVVRRQIYYNVFQRFRNCIFPVSWRSGTVVLHGIFHEGK